jgi:hypothetical protein
LNRQAFIIQCLITSLLLIYVAQYIVHYAGTLQYHLDKGEVSVILAGLPDMIRIPLVKENYQLVIILVCCMKSVFHLYLHTFMHIGIMWTVSCSCAVYQLSCDVKDFISQVFLEGNVKSYEVRLISNLNQQSFYMDSLLVIIFFTETLPFYCRSQARFRMSN